MCCSMEICLKPVLFFFFLFMKQILHAYCKLNTLLVAEITKTPVMFSKSLWSLRINFDFLKIVFKLDHVFI